MSREEAEALLRRYTTQTTIIDNGPNRFKHLDVDILEDGKKIGSYQRNYPSLIRTFLPFVQNSQVYALYSPDYTATRLMRLPDCADIGGEGRDEEGFCPAEYFIPYDPEKGLIGKWGFLSGCVWGDDSSWKVQHIDLSQAAQGVLRREERFGYLPTPSRLPLREAINLEFYREDDEYQEVEFSIRRLYSMKQGKFQDEGYDP